jgi:nucleolar protein TMA23
LARRETARRGLYSKFFRGPVLGPDDVQSEVGKTEPAPIPQIPLHHVDIKEGTKQKPQIDADEEDTVREACDKGERRREKRLRKEAERAAKKRKRQDAKNKAKDPMDERVLSSSQEQGSGLLIPTAPGEVQRVRTEKKKKKRLKLATVDHKFDAQIPVSTNIRTPEGEDCEVSRGEDCSKSSRKRRRRDSEQLLL